MKDFRYHISFYIIIPFTFAGIAALSAIVSYSITAYYWKQGAGTTWLIPFWTALIAVLAFLFGLLTVRLVLKPVQKFVDEAARFPAVSNQDINSDKIVAGDEIKRFTRVFDQVTTVLSKVEARRLFPEIIGESQAVRGVLNQVTKVAPTASTVLIFGESGTGKELLAASIYEHSHRKNKPFIKLNCVAIPEGLLESELFGHEKGSFTGATSKKLGKFEMADKGTIFLDEIGDMPLNIQAKLLRVLQEREFERVGGMEPIKVDVRFIAATNQDLEQRVKEGTFREDLYYRLNVFSLYLPPLRERREDIPILIEFFLRQTGRSAQVSPRALQSLIGYSWPGNIRELNNVVERAVLICEDDIIDTRHLPENITDRPSAVYGSESSIGLFSIDEHLDQIEKDMIVEALRKTGGVQVKAAELLGINQRSLWHRVKKYNVDVASIRDRKI